MSLPPAFHLEKRLAFGTRGRQTMMTVNCFKVTRAPDGLIQQYDVAWSAHPADKRVLMNWLLRHPSQMVLGEAGKMATFDGKASLFVYTNTRMSFDDAFYIDERQARGQPPLVPTGQATNRITVKLTWANEVNAYELLAHVNGQTSGSESINQVIQAANLLIKHEPSSVFPVTRTSFYPFPTKAGEPKGCPAGLELWRGYFASYRPAIGKVILNFDIVTGLFRQSGDLVGLLLRIMGTNNPKALFDNRAPPKLQIWRNRFLKGLKVEVSHTGEKQQQWVIYELFMNDKSIDVLSRKIISVATESASTFSFRDQQGVTWTLQEYFLQKYNISLRAPYLPAIQLSKGAIIPETAFVPMELASVVRGGTFFGRLSPGMDTELVGEMMKTGFTTLKPKARLLDIKEGLQYLRLRTSMFQHWNLDVDIQPMTVKARILPPPALSYNDARTNKLTTLVPQEGQWDIRGKKGSSPARRCDKWLVIVFANESDKRGKGNVARADIQQAVSNYVKAASQYGVIFGTPQPYINFAGANPRNVDEAVFEALRLAGFSKARPHEFLLTFCDKADARIYNAVKILCDLTMGLPCENLSLQKAIGAKPAYWSNVATKVNFKLGGVNQAIAGDPLGFEQNPTIVFGADVTHPPGFSMAPSVAAIVASHDLKATQYSAEIRLQPARQEIISDLETAALELIKKFSRMTPGKKKPTRVIFFRDGVSEGQFDQVCSEEIPALRRAIAQIPGTKPTLTYFICGKRHHVRLFPDDLQDADRSGNVKAGTIVDSDITLPYGQDFYLVSHGGLLGTSRPCHYSVLVDDAKMGPDALQTLCYYMSHLYPRSTRSVSIPTPAYLAHHAATRGRIHLGDDPEEDNISFGGARKMNKEQLEQYKLEKLQQARARFRTVKGPLADTMYYM